MGYDFESAAMGLGASEATASAGGAQEQWDHKAGTLDWSKLGRVRFDEHGVVVAIEGL